MTSLDADERQDRDGYISREEMEDVVGSVFDLMGRTGDPAAEEEIIALRVAEIFEVTYSVALTRAAQCPRARNYPYLH